MPLFRDHRYHRNKNALKNKRRYCSLLCRMTNHRNKTYLLFICFCILALFVVVFFAWMVNNSKAMVSTSKYFPNLNEDLTQVTWAHAVNSRAELDANLKNSSVMMLEADILMGSKDHSEKIPIMAHPPDKTSDLSFEEFLKEVIAKSSVENLKGIKLDFKELEAVKPVLKVLKNHSSSISFPVWLNADILSGPGGSKKATPLDAKEFIKECKHYFKQATLSLGWTTVSEGEYSEVHINDMLKVLQEAGINGDDKEITFPVRATIAVKSSKALIGLLEKAGSKSSLTIWSAADDDSVTMKKLDKFVDKVGKSRCYIDLPSSFETGRGTKAPEIDRHTKAPEIDRHTKIPEVDRNTRAPQIDRDDDRNHTENPHISGSSLTYSSTVVLSSIVLIGFALISI